MLACFLALLLHTPAQPAPEVSRLDNGLQIVIVEDDTFPLVSVQLWYRVGSANDDLHSPGLCHVTRTILEHRHDAAVRLAAAAVRFESRTLRDGCYFASVLPPTLLDDLLRVEAERMQTRRADRLEIDGALRAIACCAPGASDLSARLVAAAAFPDHPYQHPPGLVAESLRDLPVKEVNEFLKHWFVPGNATLFVIGDVQPPQVLERVRGHFGSLPWAEPPRRAAFSTSQAEQVRLPPVAADYAGLDVAWVTPPAGVFENAALDVLMQRLCNPVDGPLYRRLMEAGCLPPRWRRESWREAGLLTISVDTLGKGAEGEAVGSAVRTADADPVSEIDRIIREELTKAQETVPSEIELNRARALAARAMRNRQAAFADRALHLARQEVVAGNLLYAEWELPRIRQLAAGDLREAAAALRSARSVRLPRTTRSQTRGYGPREPSGQLVPPLKAEPAEELDGARAVRLRGATAPATAPTTSSQSTVPLVTHRLDNGVRIEVRVVPGLETAKVRTLLKPGSRVGDATAALMAVGSTQHSAGQIRDYLSYHGLDLFPLTERGQTGLVSRGPAARASQMIELQGELIRWPNRSAAACKAAADHGRQLSHWVRAAERAGEREMYLPPGFIGWRVGITPLTHAAGVRNALDRLSALQGVEILVIGDVEAGTVCEAARLTWGDWRPVADDETSPRSP